MIDLGNAKQSGAMRIAQEAVRRISEMGEGAVLLGKGGDVILLPHWTPDYADTLTRRSRHLCGVYRTPADGTPSKITARIVCDDLLAKWGEVRAA